MSSMKKSIERNVRRFDKVLKKRSFEIYLGLLRTFVQDYPTEIKETCLSLLTEGRYVDLIQWADSYGGALHPTAVETYAASQLSALIKKYPFPVKGLSEQSEKLAMVKFFAAEKRCERYNSSLKTVSNDHKRERNRILNGMREYCRRVLGDEPDLPAIYSLCTFGPGASVGVHGDSTNFARKICADEWTCTPLALPYAIAALSTDQHYFEFLLQGSRSVTCLDISDFRKRVLERVCLVHYNKIVTVPKTALVDRTIAIEPLLNGYLQKGIDQYMRLRLKRVGLDLQDQTRNQELARQGSFPVDDPFATIDLSSASDSISKELVRRVLPPAWFNLLNQVRSPHYLTSDGVERRYHKFVSMGNGFCFPLETLLFASVCSMYSRPKDFSVYGDDIIVRRSVAPLVLKDLWRIGFRHNTDKTFFEGPFRESCGADWYAGRDIRPLALDYALDSVQNVVKFHNMSLSKSLWDISFDRVRKYLFDLVPEEFRLVRPYSGTPGGAFQVPLDMFQASPFSRWERDLQAWSWWELESRSVPDKGAERHDRFATVLMMAAVRGYPSRSPFARRRKTTQSVRRKAYAGALSTWTPPVPR